MGISIPAGGSFQNSSKPWLTPQVLVDINLEKSVRVTIPVFQQSDITPSVTAYECVVNAEIQLIYIDENKVSAQLEKVLSTIAEALISDLNPSDRGARPHMELAENPINPTNFQFGLQIDNTQDIRYVSVWIQSQKLRVELATQAFERVKTYVLAALAP